MVKHLLADRARFLGCCQWQLKDMTRCCFDGPSRRIFAFKLLILISVYLCKLRVAGTSSSRHDRGAGPWATGRRMGEIGGEEVGAAGPDRTSPSLLPSGFLNDPPSRQRKEAEAQVAALEPTDAARTDLLTPPKTNQQKDTSSDIIDPRVHPTHIPDQSEPPPHSEPTCFLCRRPLKVYLYPLPRKFNFELLNEFKGKGAGGEVSRKRDWIEDIPEGLRHTVRMEYLLSYYLTADILNPHKNVTGGSIVVRTMRPAEADVFFVPFFSFLSYELRHPKGRGTETPPTKYENLQAEVLAFFKASHWWQRSEGRDHIIVISHPNALSDIRQEVRNAIFILPDFDRFDFVTARLSKDVIAPYVHLTPQILQPSDEATAAQNYRDRTTLLFFQGTVHLHKNSFELRRKVSAAVEGEEGVVFRSSRPVGQDKFDEAAIGMHNSRFCLHIAGDTGSSCRLFDSIASLCIPVIVSDNTDLPFEDILRYKTFALFFPQEQAVERGALVSFLKNIERESWLRMWINLNKVQHHFQFQVPAQRGDAVDMIWQQIAKKLPAVHHVLNRQVRLLQPEWWSLV